MNRNYGRQSLWLVLPVLALVLYFVFVEPLWIGTPEVDEVPVAPTEPEMADIEPPPEPEPPQPPGPEEVQLARDLAFISEAFPLLSSWDLAVLKPLLAEPTLAGTSDEEFIEVINVLSNRLGALQSFDVPEPVAPADDLQAGDGDDSLQHYRFTARYAAGEAEVDLVLHQLPEASKLYSFNITVPD